MDGAITYRLSYLKERYHRTHQPADGKRTKDHAGSQDVHGQL